MSTLAIPPQRVRLYRSLWDRWIIVLRILFDLGAGAHPVRWQAVADTLLVDKKTTQRYIQGLVRDGHLALAGTGYMLTEAGMSFLQETQEGENPNYLESGKNPGETFSLLKESVEVVNPELKQLTTTPPESGKNPGEIFSPEVRLALEHLPLLFDGSEITMKGLPEFPHIEHVLGWIAYAYDKRTSLHSPCGLIYSKLKDKSGPRPYIKYMQAPEDFLPLVYLDAIGRYTMTCEHCQVTFTRKPEYDLHREACVMTPRYFEEPETIDLAPDDTVTEAHLRSWGQVLDQLHTEMPRASFETWVRDTVPVHVEAGTVQIGARNVYARDWLTQRLTSTVGKRFTGFLGQAVQVVFVVAVETEALDVH